MQLKLFFLYEKSVFFFTFYFKNAVTEYLYSPKPEKKCHMQLKKNIIFSYEKKSIFLHILTQGFATIFFFYPSTDN